MQAPEGSADECLDPALMSAFEDGTAYQWHADAGPPSPFDLSTIDPDLLALYPEQGSGPVAPSPALMQPERSRSPPADESNIACGSDEQDASSPSPPKKRVRFASTPPRPANAEKLSSGRARGAGVSSRAPPTQKKYTARGFAKRTMSDGTLVPPFPCARCEWEEAECLVKYHGAACNTCRRKGRKCELVDGRVKFNGQLAKNLRKAGSGSS